MINPFDKGGASPAVQQWVNMAAQVAFTQSKFGAMLQHWSNFMKNQDQPENDGNTGTTTDLED